MQFYSLNQNIIDIRSLTEEELRKILIENDIPKYRVQQISEWIWHKNVVDFNLMSNLPIELRTWLNEKFYFNTMKIAFEQKSKDGTIKMAFKLHDGALVEGVLIPKENRMTACVSSQVGCSLACTFCATGYLKRQRNLEVFEIYDQVLHINNKALEHFNFPLSNIVFMGMGEPLLNYNNVTQAIEKITDQKGLGISVSKITVSTAGIAKMIKKMADDGLKTHLALSLHAATNEKRSKIMPINESNPLESLIEAINYYHSKTKKRITIEYAVINKTNDSLEEANELIKFARKINCKINLIEYNPIDFANFESSNQDNIWNFANHLRQNGLVANVRNSRGKDIDAACGQLANKSLEFIES